MNKLFIQVFRFDDWRNVTSIVIEPKTHREDADHAYARAYREATRQITGWAGYFDAPLRIAEEMMRGGFKEARP